MCNFTFINVFCFFVFFKNEINMTNRKKSKLTECSLLLIFLSVYLFFHKFSYVYNLTFWFSMWQDYKHIVIYDILVLNWNSDMATRSILYQIDEIFTPLHWICSLFLSGLNFYKCRTVCYNLINQAVNSISLLLKLKLIVCIIHPNIIDSRNLTIWE